MTFTKLIKNRFSKGIHQERAEKAARENAARENAARSEVAGDEKQVGSPSSESVGEDPEWKQAARAMRTASWGTIFYVITTDILGWGSIP